MVCLSPQVVVRHQKTSVQVIVRFLHGALIHHRNSEQQTSLPSQEGGLNVHVFSGHPPSRQYLCIFWWSNA